MKTNTYSEPALDREIPLLHRVTSRPAADAALEFGRFRLLLRQRQLVADDTPIELGTRALDLLMVLLEADGALVTKDELLSRVWPDIVVAAENLKVQIFALRKALGDDHHFIRTEFGRGYRFTAVIRSPLSADACQHPIRPWCRPNQKSFPTDFSMDTRTVRMSEGQASRRVDPAHARAARTGLALPCKKGGKRGHMVRTAEDSWNTCDPNRVCLGKRTRSFIGTAVDLGRRIIPTSVILASEGETKTIESSVFDNPYQHAPDKHE